MSASNVHFEGLDGVEDGKQQRAALARYQVGSNRSLLSAPAAPPEQHRRSSIGPFGERQHRHSDSSNNYESTHYTAFGGLSKYAAQRSIRREAKIVMFKNKGWESLDISDKTDDVDKIEADEATALMGNVGHRRGLSASTIPEIEATPMEALKEMFTENKINVLLVFLPFAYISHAYQWNDGSIFILNFLAMVPLASMLGGE